jgi:hypothetical protein
MPPVLSPDPSAYSTALTTVLNAASQAVGSLQSGLVRTAPLQACDGG